MVKLLDTLGAEDLRQLSGAIGSGRLAAPFTAVSVRRFIPGELSDAVAGQLEQLRQQGFTPQQISWLLDTLAQERGERRDVLDLLEIVCTGPDAPGSALRDTAVVVRELFSHAREEVLVAGYAVYQGNAVFRALADRMTELPELKVRMFLDVQRPMGDTSSETDILMRFSQRFRQKEWPGTRLPEVFYDPRSLDLDTAHRACLHAKCVVVDREKAFVSSANFTEAAQERNIEVGVLIRAKPVAERLRRHFEALAAQGNLRKVPGL